MEHRKVLKGIEATLMSLSSDEARARAISKLIRKGDLPIPKISWVIEYYEKVPRRAKSAW